MSEVDYIKKHYYGTIFFEKGKKPTNNDQVSTFDGTSKKKKEHMNKINMKNIKK